MPERGINPRTGQESLEWIELSDFTPGIHSGFFGGDGQQAIDGALQDDTYSCVGHPGGGLVPGPRLVQSYSDQFVLGTAHSDVIAFYNFSPVGEYETYIARSSGWT